MTDLPDGAAIKVEDIAYSYGDVEAVKGISFDVEPGQIMGFLGPNGAGKSTTIKMLTGQLKPKRGKIFILGMEGGQDRPEIQQRIGVCFEEKNLYLNMTARENLEFFAKLFGISDYDATEALRRVDLAGREDDRVSGFSKGMKQRLMVARALVNQPDVIFLDEPTDGLDPTSSQAIRAVIREEAERGAAILLTTHDMHEADELSDKVAFINEGEIVAMDTPENLKLQFGTRAVRVRLRADGGVREEIIPLDDEGASQRVAELVRDPDLMTVHTEEASLEAIFIQLTGRGLE
ncbi:MAG: ABC transporter ATP-binding protein [Coriobacteriia bacterium]